MNIAEARVGQRVLFGRENGEKTLGEIVKVNAKCAKIKQIEERGNHSVGTVWRVPYQFLTCIPHTTTTEQNTPSYNPWFTYKTYKTIYVNDLLGHLADSDSIIEKVWEAINDSDVSFGSNHDTLIHPDTFFDIVDNIEEIKDDDKIIIESRIKYIKDKEIVIALGS